MMTWLKDCSYEFHRYATNNEKPKSFIIWGLTDSIDENAISNALKEANLNTH